MSLRPWLVASIAIGLAVGIAATTLRVSGAVTRLDRGRASDATVVVELFTSEGCSSCPPADLLLAQMIERAPVPGVHVIGLSEHVDYWDQLGWRDPFSDALFTARQKTYAAHARGASLDNVYTPQMIVDGDVALVGSDADAARAAIASAAGRRKLTVRATWSATSPLTLDIAVEGTSDDAGSHVVVAVAEDHVQVKVPRGENAGRTLAHSGVTRFVRDVGRLDKSGTAQLSTALSVKDDWRRDHLRAVVMVTDVQTGRIHGAAEVALYQTMAR